MVINQKHFNCTRRFSWLIILLAGIITLSCTKHSHKNDVKPEEKIMPDIRTGQAILHPLGGLVEKFNVNFEKIGNVPIEEYGMAYLFQVEPTFMEPVLDGPNPVVKFKGEPKQGSITETVNIGFPAGTHAVTFRAYVKIKGGEVLYAENSFKINY
ncbi:hypothetical protein SAMN04487996_11978 [Dyadobacter soli]|uniref:Uncharacterized protein n=1 Tax=Dyadobacter soli TaxID=659014 RepID=A0A1G7UQP7_9BACT|nr:hypothetical protein [Dyadobacter soli]SDG49935.1 hypothetical protein SAMN04487996_11978 [Dyadobacter soli]